MSPLLVLKERTLSPEFHFSPPGAGAATPPEASLQTPSRPASCASLSLPADSPGAASGRSRSLIRTPLAPCPYRKSSIYHRAMAMFYVFSHHRSRYRVSDSQRQEHRGGSGSRTPAPRWTLPPRSRCSLGKQTLNSLEETTECSLLFPLQTPRRSSILRGCTVFLGKWRFDP